MPRRRPRPEEVAQASARLLAVLPPRAVGGWVPPVEAAHGWVPQPDDDDARSEAAATPPPCRAAATPPPSAAAATGQASWSPREEPPTADGPPERAALPLWLTFDPGRRGVGALVLVAVAAAVLAGCFVLRSRPVEVAAPPVARPGVAVGEPAAPAGEVVVSVSGRVRRPGLVRLPAGSRVDDAIRAAGGATVAVGLLNLARRLVDGEQVLVGVAGSPGAVGTAGAGPGAAGGLLDLNTATAAQLDALPGIGPVLAQRIVDWRAAHGRFGSVDQLREVPGIGESKYLQVKPKVVV